MSTVLRHVLTAGLIGATLLGAALPAGAGQAGAAQAALAKAEAGAFPGEGYSQYYYGRGRGYGYRRGGAGVAAGVIGGLAAGALIGGAIAGSAPGYAYGPGPYAPPPPAYGPVQAYGPGPQPVGNVYGRDPHWVSYCASRYRSFDPVSGTYLAGDGYRYPCE